MADNVSNSQDENAGDLLSKKFSQWLDQRVPKAESVTLSQRSIFVFPTKAGLYFIVLQAILLLTAINYQNSMMYLLVFLLSVLFVFTILLSFQNLQGLSITLSEVDECYLGEKVLVTFQLINRPKYFHSRIALCWPGESEVTIDVPEDSSGETAQLTLTPLARGLFKSRRLMVESVYPFGIIRAWSWLDLNVNALVYPSQIQGNPERTSVEEMGDGEQVAKSGTEEFRSLREYQPGDSLKHVAWKQYAKKNQLLTKEFESPNVNTNVFALSDYKQDTLEDALSHLCFDIVDSERRGDIYALTLDGWTSDLGNGERHKSMCLSKLALY